jgi:hypothetical protein
LKPSGKGPIKNYLPQDPRDLGSKGISAYKDLGLLWAPALLDFVHEKNSSEDMSEKPKQPRKSMKAFEKDLLEAFNDIVTIACCGDPTTFNDCEYLDDFLGQSSGQTGQFGQALLHQEPSGQKINKEILMY